MDRTAIIQGNPSPAPESSFPERRLAELLHAVSQWGMSAIPRNWAPHPSECENVLAALAIVQMQQSSRELLNDVDPGSDWIYWLTREGDFFGLVAPDGSIKVRQIRVYEKPNYFGFSRNEEDWINAVSPKGWKYQYREVETKPLTRFITPGSALEW